MRLATWILAGLALAVLPALAQTSGLPPGARTPAYDPTHIAGPDRGTTVCPV
ncbi:MAG: hypothetical protein AB1758_03370 [Candidatus Eremiobacterota bacterium]